MTLTKFFRKIEYFKKNGVEGIEPAGPRPFVANPFNPTQGTTIAIGQIVNWKKLAKRQARRQKKNGGS